MTAVFIDSGMPALRALARLGAIKKKKPVARWVVRVDCAALGANYGGALPVALGIR